MRGSKAGDGFALFLDESGNTGRNLLDLSQPFYVLAGWAVPLARKESLDGLVTQLVGTLGAEELKGRRLLRSSKGRAVVRQLLPIMDGCIPVAEVTEKRFVLVGRLIDTFLDPAYNPEVPHPFLLDAVAKQRVAERVYLLPDAVLQEGAGALACRESALLERVANRLSVHLRGMGERELAAAFEAATSVIGPIAAELSENGHDFAPPIFSMHGLFGWADRRARKLDTPPVLLIADSIGGMEELTMRTWDRAQSFESEDILLTSGTTLTLGYERVLPPAFADSRSEPLLQAADVLASCLSATVEGVAGDRGASAEAWSYARRTLGCYRDGVGHLNLVVAQQLGRGVISGCDGGPRRR